MEAHLNVHATTYIRFDTYQSSSQPGVAPVCGVATHSRWWRGSLSARQPRCPCVSIVRRPLYALGDLKLLWWSCMTASSRNPGEILEVFLQCAPPLPVSIPVYTLEVSTYQTTLWDVSFQTVLLSGYVMKESAAATPCCTATQSARKVDNATPFMIGVSRSGRTVSVLMTVSGTLMVDLISVRCRCGRPQ